MNRNVLLFVCVCLIPFSAFAQDSLLDKAKENFDAPSLQRLIETDVAPTIRGKVSEIKGRTEQPQQQNDAEKSEVSTLSEEEQRALLNPLRDEITGPIDLSAVVPLMEDDGFERAEKFTAYPSLFLQDWQRANIDDARNFRGLVYEAYLQEQEAIRQREALMRSLEQDRENAEARVTPEFAKRFVHLQGILYNAKDNWAVWINGQKVTPDEVPNNIADISVHKDYAEFKWYDEYSNKVLPLRMRPLERFHIDSRVFLKGQ